MYWMSFPIRASRQGSTNNISCSYFIPNPFRSFLSSRVYITHAAVEYYPVQEQGPAQRRRLHARGGGGFGK